MKGETLGEMKADYTSLKRTLLRTLQSYQRHAMHCGLEWKRVTEGGKAKSHCEETPYNL